MHNFILVNCDTDSIMVCKHDQSLFSQEEKINLLKELNSLFPPRISWEDDGSYRKVVCLKAKNYIMQNEKGEIKYKGSALKSSKLEPALKEFLHKIIDSILRESYNYKQIYESYVSEILNLKDISRWSTKRTITEKVLNGTRTNETKVMDALEGTEFSEGDKRYFYFDKEKNLKLVENYNNDHSVEHLLKRLFDTSKILNNIIPEGTFLNYSLKRNQKLLDGRK